MVVLSASAAAESVLLGAMPCDGILVDKLITCLSQDMYFATRAVMTLHLQCMRSILACMHEDVFAVHCVSTPCFPAQLDTHWSAGGKHSGGL